MHYIIKLLQCGPKTGYAWSKMYSIQCVNSTWYISSFALCRLTTAMLTSVDCWRLSLVDCACGRQEPRSAGPTSRSGRWTSSCSGSESQGITSSGQHRAMVHRTQAQRIRAPRLVNIIFLSCRRAPLLVLRNKFYDLSTHSQRFFE